MSPLRQTLFTVGEVLFILAGLATGLMSESGETTSLAGTAVGCAITATLMPLLMVFLVKVNIAMGFFKSPWDEPHLTRIPSRWDDPLPYIQLLGYVLAAVAIGAGISIAWNGLAGVHSTLLLLGGAVGWWIGFVRLRAKFTQLCKVGPSKTVE